MTNLVFLRRVDCHVFIDLYSAGGKKKERTCRSDRGHGAQVIMVAHEYSCAHMVKRKEREREIDKQTMKLVFASYSLKHITQTHFTSHSFSLSHTHTYKQTLKQCCFCCYCMYKFFSVHCSLLIPALLPCSPCLLPLSAVVSNRLFLACVFVALWCVCIYRVLSLSLSLFLFSCWNQGSRLVGLASN